MEALVLAVIGVTNIICFVIGARVGQKVSRGETVDLPNLNPVKAISDYKDEYRDKKQAEREQERIDTIMRNIEWYDGTSRGQEDVPRG